MWKYNNIDEMYHHGILGMHWGIRRFQRKDGRLTSRGKKRKMSQDALEAKKLGKKKLREMTNDEIKTLNKRKQLEVDYKRLNKRNIAIGMAAIGTTVTLLSNYNNLKSNIPGVISDGKAIANRFKNKFI